MAAQLTLTKGFSRRSESMKIMRAAISLPTPLSPRISTVAQVFATLAMVSRISTMRGDELKSMGRSKGEDRGAVAEPAARDGHQSGCVRLARRRWGSGVLSARAPAIGA